MNPAWYLVMVFASAFTLGCLASYPVAYRRGWGRATIDAGDRHRHRHGDRQETTLLELPRAGRLSVERLADPTPLPGEPPWVFAGGTEEWRPLGQDEYDLMTAEPDRGPGEITTVEQAIALDLAMADQLSDDETPSAFTRRMAREVEAMIAAWEGDTNYWLHTHRADT